MTYKQFIDDIVSQRGYHKNYNKKIDGFEIHHIVPKCMGGNNKSENLVALTVPEHLVAHLLLFQENKKNKKLLTALYHMSNEIGINRLLEITNNEKEFIKLTKEIEKAKSSYNIKGKNNPMYRKHHTEKSKKIMKERKKGMYDGKSNPMWGKHHTGETKMRISQQRTGSNNPRARKVYCKELNMTFDTILDALKYVGIKNGIVQCCSDKYDRLTAGRHPETNEKLHWEYV